MGTRTFGVMVTSLVALASGVASAEQVKCQLGPSDAQTTVEIAWDHSAGSPAGFQMLTATVKTPARRWGDSYTVKRKQKNGVVFYSDVLGENNFSLSIHSATVAGENLQAEFTMDRGLVFEQKVSDLSCTFSGAPNPPVVACPKPGELNPALAYAAKHESTERVEWLLDCGAAVDGLDRLGCTPLLSVTDLACGYRGGEAPVMSSRDSLSLQNLMKLFIDRGANLDAQDPVNGETPLIKLVKYGNSSAVFDLILRKPSVNAQNKNGTTALMVAAASGNDVMVRTLLDGKPDLALKNNQGKTAYKIAEDKGYDYLLRFLEVKASSQTVMGKDDGTCTPTRVHIFKGKPVEVVLKATKDQMFLMTAPDLGLEIMAMPGDSASQTITPTQSGTFPFTCGVHGAEKQTQGSFMVM